MRYSASPPDFVSEDRKFTTFNARRDNLKSPFWSECFRRNHGFIVLRGFFEWVAVRDLVKAGRVSLDQVKAEFEKQRNQRVERLLQEQRPVRPTKAEQTEAIFRKTVIEFHPDGMSELLVPVIFSKKDLPNGEVDFGFAIVTDDPPPEVREAGHDRCPVFLDRPSVEEWTKGAQKLSAESLDVILARRLPCSFAHRLAAG
jgi:putative SOS response-associated peptidase YedK